MVEYKKLSMVEAEKVEYKNASTLMGLSSIENKQFVVKRGDQSLRLLSEFSAGSKL